MVHLSSFDGPEAYAHPKFFFGGGGRDGDPEAIHNLCLSVETML